MTRGCERKTRAAAREATPGQLRRRIAAFLLAVVLGCGAAETVASEDSGKTQAGDLVAVIYSVLLADGAPVRPAAPEEVVAGGTATVPGLGEAVLGMAPGDKKDVPVPPEKGYGASDPAKIVRFPTVRHMPKVVRIPAAEYVKRFGTFPTVGKEVDLGPYLKARVSAVTEQQAELEAMAKGEGKVEEPFGAVETRTEGEAIVFRLIPALGAPFAGPGGVEGRITGADNDAFTVDFNPPLAGRALVYHIEALSLVKASHVQGAKIAWGEDHDRGLAEAKRARKPVVLVLYAEWCSWCKKLFGESLPDPRIRMLSDRFVWVKVNSDLDKKIYGKYGQNGFPLIVLLSPDGDVVGRIDGFRDGAALYGELSSLLKGKKEGAS